MCFALHFSVYKIAFENYNSFAHFVVQMLKQEVGRSQSKQQFDSSSSSSGSGCCYHEVFSRLANQVDAVHNLAMRSLPRAAESLGAVEVQVE